MHVALIEPAGLPRAIHASDGAHRACSISDESMARRQLAVS
jgi:hypothetical protein